MMYSKTCLKRHLKRRPNIGFQDQLSLNAGQKYCRMHSAILSTFIKLPFAIKIFVLSIFEWSLKTGLTVCYQSLDSLKLYEKFKGEKMCIQWDPIGPDKEIL